MMNPVSDRRLGVILEKGNMYTRQEQRIQQVVALASASVSLLSGLVSFYWFAKIKRNYRHQYVAGTRPPRFGIPVH